MYRNSAAYAALRIVGWLETFCAGKKQAVKLVDNSPKHGVLMLFWRVIFRAVGILNVPNKAAGLMACRCFVGFRLIVSRARMCQ